MVDWRSLKEHFRLTHFFESYRIDLKLKMHIITLNEIHTYEDQTIRNAKAICILIIILLIQKPYFFFFRGGPLSLSS